ncbi:hypothetical protein [Nocardia vaccinii]|uniref:hypothetical protein n=1 Tax=Nocardia vaccinii TaxID=1822 RepID=UPI0008346719|nr:hypothetical protein [Nocardia vaccinii]
MTDPDFASFGEPNRSRPEGYRLTHPRNEQAAGSTNGLTGFDPGRGSLGRPEVAVGWTPADPAPEWSSGATPSVAPESQSNIGERAYGRAESLMSAPDSVAIRPDFGTAIADSVAAGRQPENSPGTSAQFPSGSNGSEFSAFGAPAVPEPRSANPPPRMPHTESARTASNTPPATTEFSAPPAPEPSKPVPDPAFRTDAEPAGESPGLPRRTPGLPHRFTDSDESDYAYSQPIVNLLDSQFDSPPPARRNSGGSGNLTNGSAYTSTESGHFTNNSLLATAERDTATATDAPPDSTEFGTRTGGPALAAAPAPLPERSAPAAGPEQNSTATGPIPNSTSTGTSAERAPRARTTSGLTAPDSTDVVDSPTPPTTAPPRSRMSRKAAERAAAEAASTTAPDDRNQSSTTSPDATPLRRTRTAEPRRSSPQDDATKNIDVHLIMHLLLASHTLENIADKAEAGDVSLEEFIRAARRTRTAAVDLVSAWFGGADQMRQFAQALLAASDSA